MTLTEGPSINMDKMQALVEAGRVWQATVAEIPALKKRIREEAEELIEREVARRQKEAAKAIQVARDAGASKASIREMTTKAHWDFEGYIALGEALARGEEDAEYVSQRHVAEGARGRGPKERP